MNVTGAADVPRCPIAVAIRGIARNSLLDAVARQVAHTVRCTPSPPATDDADRSRIGEARYANYAEIGHNASEFVFDFGQVWFDGIAAGVFAPGLRGGDDLPIHVGWGAQNREPASSCTAYGAIKRLVSSTEGKVIYYEPAEWRHSFTRADGQTYGKMEIERAFAVFRTVAGLRRELTIHSTRHTAAPWMIIAGRPISESLILRPHSPSRTLAPLAPFDGVPGRGVPAR